MKQFRRAGFLLIFTFVVMVFNMATCSIKQENKQTFFDEKGLKVTRQGEFFLDTTAVDSEGQDIDITERVNVSISEGKNTEKDGFKTVEAVFKIDTRSIPEGCRNSAWLMAFDMYTGTSFEYYDPADSGNKDAKPAAFSFKCGKRQVEVQMAYSIASDEENDMLTVIINVTCPDDYDGTVFQIGYSDTAINEVNADWPYSERTYTIDELPGFDTNGHDYYYFESRPHAPAWWPYRYA